MQKVTDRQANVGKPDVLFIHKVLWSKFAKKFEERFCLCFLPKHEFETQSV